MKGSAQLFRSATSAAFAAVVATATIVPALSKPAAADQSFCIVDERNGEVYCGRPASRDEIRRAERSNRRYNDRLSRDRDYNSVEDQRRLLLTRLYQDVLGRSVDRDGLKTYERRLRNGWSESRVRKDLANSSEARDRLNDIYRRVLNRDIDSGGLRTYRRRLADDWSLEDVARAVRRSDEARNPGGFYGQQ